MNTTENETENETTLVFEFGEHKCFVVDGEVIKTDHYGHLEIDADSFLVGAVLANSETANLHEAVRKFLLAHQREEESA